MELKIKVEYLQFISLVSSGLVDIFIFYKITNIKFKKNYKYLIVLGIIVFLVFNERSNIFIAIGNILEILAFYIIFYRKDRILVLGSAILVSLISLMIDLFSSISSSIILQKKETIILFRIIFLILFLILVNKFSDYIFRQLTQKYKNIFLILLIINYVTIESLSVVYVYSDTTGPAWLFLSLVILLETCFSILIYILLTRFQNTLLDKQEQEQKQKEYLQLKEYASYLESSEDDLRKFRHDYRNMLNSLRVSIQDGNAEEALEKLNQYTNTNLNSKALLKYKDVNHIHVTSLKSIIITKLSELYSLGIPYNFECRHRLSSLPDKLDEFDLIRLIGISLDNAIEESNKIIKQTGNKENAEIQIMIYASAPGVLELEIRNKILEKIKSINQLQAKGYTTKKGHAGLGLANIAELEDKYPGMSISYTIQDDYFDFYMMFDDTEDGE